MAPFRLSKTPEGKKSDRLRRISRSVREMFSSRLKPQEELVLTTLYRIRLGRSFRVWLEKVSEALNGMLVYKIVEIAERAMRKLKAGRHYRILAQNSSLLVPLEVITPIGS